MTSPGGKAQKFGGDLASKVHLDWALSGAPRREQVMGRIARENTYPSEIPGFRRWKHGKVVLPLPFRPGRGQKKKRCTHYSEEITSFRWSFIRRRDACRNGTGRVKWLKFSTAQQSWAAKHTLASFPGPQEESSKVTEKSQSLTFKNRKI